MKKFSLICLSIIILSGLLFSGCSTKTEPIPLSTSIQTGEDIKITLSANRTVYKASGINADNLFDYKITIEYTGDEEGITIYHSSSIGCFNMIDENDVPIVEAAVHSDLTTTVLKKNEPIIVEWNGKFEYEQENNFTNGIYTIEAFIPLRTTENGNDSKYILELPLIIE